MTFNSLNTLSGVSTFINCSNLTYFSANNLRDIPNGSFSGCTKLENVYVASSASFRLIALVDISSVKSIGSWGFL
ncbi:hypothetical protein [Flavobacterium ginsenosidimutans]|uniref:hypothetical protein n=1 Tax=Flavobacterium ginsenosidimutans TaxID=687844 RepID=UPI003BAF008E